MAKTDLSAIKPLPLRVAHQRYETAYSLLNRLAVRNGCKSLPHLFQRVPSLLGMPKWPRRELAITLASALSGSDRHAISRSTPCYARKKATIADYCGPASALTFRICPKCITEDTFDLSTISAQSAAFVRDFWHIHAIKHCRKHWVELIPKCRRCKALFSYATLSGFRCSCGSDIRSAKPRTSMRGDIVREYEIFQKMDRVPAGYRDHEARNTERNPERRVYWSSNGGDQGEISVRQLMLEGPQILKPIATKSRWDLEPWELYVTAGPYLQKLQDERDRLRNRASYYDR